MEENLQPMLVVAAVAAEGERLFLARRGPGREQEGFWEFPGGKVRPGEDPRTALQREIQEELGVACVVGQPLGVGRFSRGIVLGYRVEFEKRPLRSTDHDQLEWVPRNEILKRPLATGDYEIAVAAIGGLTEVERLGVSSVVRLAVGVYFLLGLAVAGGLFFVQQFLAGFLPPGAMPEQAMGLSAVFALPLLYAVMGALAALMVAGLYNFLARWLGGVQLGLRRQ